MTGSQRPIQDAPGWPKPGLALRQALASGYRPRDLRADLLAGVIVGIVALPLSMALAIACGVPPQHGLYTAIVAGAVTAICGGSSLQVSGPTAAFVVLLAPVAAKFGIAGLLVATLLAGFFLIFMALGRFGRWIEFVPYPVTTGFTAGIATVIAVLQLRDFLGLPASSGGQHVLDRLAHAATGLASMHWPDFAVGCLTLASLLLWPRLFPKIPAALVALLAATLVALFLARVVDGFSVSTIGSRFHYTIGGVSGQGIPRLPPIPHWPWNHPGPAGLPFHLSWELLRDLLPAAFAIAILGAIESLLSAVVADGMRGTRHDPDAELLGQGIGNLLASFFGGFAATGAIARTATSIRSGARSPVAAVVHALFVLFAMLLAAPLLSFLPMASLAALLLLVAWNMGEARHFLRLLKTSPRGDVFLLVACFLLTVLFDMVVAVTAGVLLGSLLFMQRMARVAETQAVGGEHPELARLLPQGVVVYRIAGPLFFGAAQKAMAALQRWEKGVRAVVLDLSAVPLLDGTGLVQLESAADRLHRAGVLLVLAGTQPQPLETLLRGGWRGKPGVAFRGRLSEAVEEAERLTSEPSGPRAEARQH